MTEPGDNITNGSFRWLREMESMPGWTVTVPWLTGKANFTSFFLLDVHIEEGMPRKGIVNFTYTSNAPVMIVRHALLTQVLISEPPVETSTNGNAEIDCYGLVVTPFR